MDRSPVFLRFGLFRSEVWNLEGEIYDYFPGDDLEFHIAAEVWQMMGFRLGWGEKFQL